MTRNGRGAAGAAVLLLIAAATASADDEDGPVIEGSATMGWRVISGESEGTFQQDVGLHDGPRLFDAHVLLIDDREEAALNELEATAFGVGEENTDYTLTLRRNDVFDIRGGYRRDDYSYRATADPFPYDTTRERTFLDGRYTPSRHLTIRVEFDRLTRRGDAYVQTLQNRRELPAPAGVDPEIVGQRRPLDQSFDTYVVGADWGQGIWRAGVTTSLRDSDIDDERYYDIPRSKRGDDPIREVLDRKVRAKTYTGVAKGGVTLLDGDLDLDGFFTWSRTPLDGRVSGDADGFDNGFFDGTVRGAYSAVTSGDIDTTRHASSWRAVAAWRPIDELEFVATAEQDEIVDDTGMTITETRVYARDDVTPLAIPRSLDARITDRNDRASLESIWDVTRDLRVRGGYERLDEDLQVPDDTPGGSLDPTDTSSRTHRVLFGVDAKPVDGLSLSVLGRIGHDDEPASNASAERADEFVFRGRYRISRELTVSGVYRERDFHQESDFDSTSRSRSWTASATWTPPIDLQVSASVTRQTFDTHTGTRFFDLRGAAVVRARDTVGFVTRDLIAHLDATYSLTSTTRLQGLVTYVDSGGDYVSRSSEGSLLLEHDIRDDLTLGLRVRGWHFDEDNEVDTPDDDDYDVQAVEFSVTYRF